ncbi:MAG: DUF4209 domain-containing protein [Phycisphaerales bacterium]
MVRAVCATHRHGQIELTLGRELAELSSDETIEESHRHALIPDALAFELFHGPQRPWGGAYFGPWASGPAEDGKSFERPGRSRITPEVINTWRSRRETVTHAIAVARYSDAAWDLALLAGVSRDPDDARAAVDAYLTDDGWPTDSRIAAERFQRAHVLAKSISDRERVESIETSITQRTLEPNSDRWMRHLAADLLLIDSKELPDESTELIQRLEESFGSLADNGDAFEAQSFGDRLLAIYRRIADKPAEEAIARHLGACFEQMGGQASAIVALAHFKTAFKYYRDAGLRKDAERLKGLIASASKRSTDEMAVFSHEVKIPTEEIEKYADELTKGDLDEARRRFFFGQLLTTDKVDKSLDESTKDAVMMRIMPREVMTVEGNTVHLPPLEEARDLHRVHHAAQLISFNAVFSSVASDRFVTRHDLDADALAGFGEKCGLFPRNRHRIRHAAFQSYLAGYHARFIHLIVPQIEHALRLLLREAGKSSNVTRDDQTWRQLTLTQVLKQKELRDVLGEDGCFYLSVLLTEDLGLNIRDLVCHGLVADDWFGKGISDRLLHAVIGLTLFEVVVPADADEVKEGEPASDAPESA